MGAACGKNSLEEEVEVRAVKRGVNRKKVVSPNNTWEEHYTLKLECFTVPADRLLVNLERFKAGMGCRAVGVSTVLLEKKDVPVPQGTRQSNLNSVLYTPVLQWFGLDVKKQVPKYLPMNVWPGSYTVFGFYEPENMGNTHVTLSGRIGSEEVYLEEVMNTKRSLSAEEWSILSGKLERELQKLHPELSTPHVPLANIRLETLQEVSTHVTVTSSRVSQDTGYVSVQAHAIQDMTYVTSQKSSTDPLEHPYSGLKYHDVPTRSRSVSVTSESEDGNQKENTDTKEKKISVSKLRRKDTPSHQGMVVAMKLAKQFESQLSTPDEFLLEEDETEPTELDEKQPEILVEFDPEVKKIISNLDQVPIQDVGSVTSSVMTSVTDQVFDLNAETSLLDEDIHMPTRLTKSCQDLTLLKEPDTPEKPSLTSLSSPAHRFSEPKSPLRKKKRSLVSKVGKSPSQGNGDKESPYITEARVQVCPSDEADDELSLSESKAKPTAGSQVTSKISETPEDSKHNKHVVSITEYGTDKQVVAEQADTSEQKKIKINKHQVSETQIVKRSSKNSITDSSHDDQQGEIKRTVTEDITIEVQKRNKGMSIHIESDIEIKQNRIDKKAGTEDGVRPRSASNSDREACKYDKNDDTNQIPAANDYTSGDIENRKSEADNKEKEDDTKTGDVKKKENCNSKDKGINADTKVNVDNEGTKDSGGDKTCPTSKQAMQNVTFIQKVLKVMTAEKNDDSTENKISSTHEVNIDTSPCQPSGLQNNTDEKENIEQKTTVDKRILCQNEGQDKPKRASVSGDVRRGFKHAEPVQEKENFKEKGREAKLIKTQSVAKIKENRVIDNTNKRDNTNRFVKGKSFNRGSDSGSSETEGGATRGHSKSFSNPSRPHARHFEKRRVRQSLEAKTVSTTADSRKGDLKQEAVSKPFEAFGE